MFVPLRGCSNPVSGGVCYSRERGTDMSSGGADAQTARTVHSATHLQSPVGGMRAQPAFNPPLAVYLTG
jgi:hypothetical protein